MWIVLTLVAKLYLAILLVSSIYIAYSLMRILRALRRLPVHTSTASGSLQLVQLSLKVENIRQFETFLVLLFGVFFANETFDVLREVQMINIGRLSAATMHDLVPLPEFAFVVLVAMTLLHTFQWIVAARVATLHGSN